MNDGRSRSAASTDDGQQNSWFDFLKQAISREPGNKDELVKLLRNAYKNNLLDLDALSMIEGVLQVSEMQVRDVMVTRTQMVVVNHGDAPEAFLPNVVESAHSRFPVIGDNRDEVVGILLAKDLLSYFVKSSGGNGAAFDIKELLRPAVFVPESKRLNVLLREFRANRNHMAIVVDEYGGIAGLVTIEDVIEQIVGDIEDEHDFEDELYIIKHSDTRYTAKALTPIEDFNEQFDSDFSDEEFDTIGGLLINEFGHMPKRGEVKAVGRFRFKVLRADSRRIYLLQVTVLKSKNEQQTHSVDVA